MNCPHFAALNFRSATASGNNENGPNCVEVAALDFFKATASNPSGSCVEIAYAKAERSAAAGHCVEVGPARKATKSAAAGHCVTVSHTKATASGTATYCVEPGVAVAPERELALVGAGSSTDAPDQEHVGCTPETCSTPGIEPGDIVVRDSKLGADSPLIVWSPEAWRGYVATVIEGGMETGGPLGYIMRDPRNPGMTLDFNAGEADAFRDGCTKGEFNYQP